MGFDCSCLLWQFGGWQQLCDTGSLRNVPAQLVSAALAKAATDTLGVQCFCWQRVLCLLVLDAFTECCKCIGHVSVHHTLCVVQMQRESVVVVVVGLACGWGLGLMVALLST